MKIMFLILLSAISDTFCSLVLNSSIENYLKNNLKQTNIYFFKVTCYYLRDMKIKSNILNISEHIVLDLFSTLILSKTHSNLSRT